VTICNSVLTHHFLVPVIVVFTKYDQFLRNVRFNWMDSDNIDRDVNPFDVAERQFEEHYLCHLDGLRFVRLESPFNIKCGGDVLTF
jgi:hypothetical protein